MNCLKGEYEKQALNFLNQAIELAKSSTCLRAKCGAIIVKNNQIIGKGFNSPPANKESQRRCQTDKDKYHRKITDKTCCVHAEQRAIIDALIKNPEEIKDSAIYFIRLDNKDKVIKSGKPYCTICSKMALDVGIKDFVLWHKQGICSYDTERYNEISYNFKN